MNYLYIQIIYTFNERIIFIQPIKYIYSTNELNWNLVFILYEFTKGAGLKCT